MFGNLGKMMSQMGQIKQNMEKIEKELKNTIIKGTSDDGIVQIEVNGKLELHNVMVNEKATELSAKQIELHIRHALDQALSQASALAKAKLKDATGGLDLPGMM